MSTSISFVRHLNFVFSLSWKLSLFSVRRRQRKILAVPWRREHIDWNLHDTIIGSLNNEIIWRKYQTNNIKMRLINEASVFASLANVIPVMEEHLKVLEAIETRTPQLEMDAITVHINNARSLALKI